MGCKGKIEFFCQLPNLFKFRQRRKILADQTCFVEDKSIRRIICFCPKISKWGHFGPTDVASELASENEVWRRRYNQGWDMRMHSYENFRPYEG